MVADALSESLRAADLEIESTQQRHGGARWSLDPDRVRALGLLDIAELLRDDAQALGATDAFEEGLASLGHAIAHNFADNLFWDLTGLAQNVLDGAKRANAPSRYVAASFDDLVTLHALFGAHTPIRFRYVHDFVYGFDWAKWIQRDPEARAHIGPFDPPYLRAMIERGHELLELIERDDEVYPRLHDDEGARNPFRFSREPADELRLFTALRCRDLIPVRVWERRPTACWDRAFHRERERLAFALNLEREPTTRRRKARGRAPSQPGRA